MFGLVDLAVLVIVVLVLAIPGRAMMASPVIKADGPRFEVALAEARALAAPTDPVRAEDLAQKLGSAACTPGPASRGCSDWAVEAAVDGATRAKASPTRWRALLAASVAYVDRLDPKPALAYVEQALAACTAAGEPSCPGWERTRMEFYRDHLDAGIASGIDPRHDPAGFSEAAEHGIRRGRIVPTR